jgi:DNA repair protein RadC
MGAFKNQAPITTPSRTSQTISLSDTLHIIGRFTLHNHPSGDMRPSDDDLSLTRRLRDAGKILGIELHDHIIIADGSGYTSLKENGIF